MYAENAPVRVRTGAFVMYIRCSGGEYAMKIFLSYGHDFQEEAARLAEGLKKLGYEVWIDYERIVAGDDGVRRSPRTF